MMFHPFDRDILAHPALASHWLQMRFTGTPAHASAAPWDGKSALTACLDTFRLVDSQRVHFHDGVRVHGFVTDGGQAVNIIPEHAACELSVRARTLPELERVKAIVEDTPGSQVVKSEPLYLYATMRTRLMKYTDDVEFAITDPAAGVIHARSSSRLGGKDFGANRKRIEAIRARFGQASS